MGKSDESRPKLRKITLISSILICVLAIGAAAAAGLAWHATNKTTEVGRTDAYKVESISGISVTNCKVYYVEDGEVKMQDISDPGDVSMPPYDTLFPERNADTPVIIRVALNFIPEVSEEISMNVTCPEKSVANSWVDANGLLTAKLSNLITINAVCDASLDRLDPVTDLEEIYRGARAAMKDAGKVQFATVDESDLTRNLDKVSSIDINLAGYTVQAQNQVTVYLEYDYSDTQVAAFVLQKGIILPENYEGEGTLAVFPNDLGNVVFTPIDEDDQED